MTQKAYTDLNLEAWDPVSISGMQTRATDILHGTFRTELKLEGYHGGSCASFFWYHDDSQELDIEVVTPGTSIVNDTINYTTQPSVNADWSRIPGATFSLPLQKTMSEFRTHRFDCDSNKGASYFLDDKLLHTDTHNIPKDGGSLQLKLWADGNKWWSGLPSKTDVHMHVRSIIAYFNTTSSLTNEKWNKRCAREGKQTPCKAVTSTHPRDKSSVDPCRLDPKSCATFPTATVSSGVTIVPLLPKVSTLSPTVITTTSRCGFAIVSECQPTVITTTMTPLVTIRPTSSANQNTPNAVIWEDNEGTRHLDVSGSILFATLALLFMLL